MPDESAPAAALLLKRIEELEVQKVQLSEFVLGSERELQVKTTLINSQDRIIAQQTRHINTLTSEENAAKTARDSLLQEKVAWARDKKLADAEINRLCAELCLVRENLTVEREESAKHETDNQHLSKEINRLKKLLGDQVG